MCMKTNALGGNNISSKLKKTLTPSAPVPYRMIKPRLSGLFCTLRLPGGRGGRYEITRMLLDLQEAVKCRNDVLTAYIVSIFMEHFDVRHHFLFLTPTFTNDVTVTSFLVLKNQKKDEAF